MLEYHGGSDDDEGDDGFASEEEAAAARFDDDDDFMDDPAGDTFAETRMALRARKVVEKQRAEEMEQMQLQPDGAGPNRLKGWTRNAGRAAAEERGEPLNRRVPEPPRGQGLAGRGSVVLRRSSSLDMASFAFLRDGSTSPPDGAARCPRSGRGESRVKFSSARTKV